MRRTHSKTEIQTHSFYKYIQYYLNFANGGRKNFKVIRVFNDLKVLKVVLPTIGKTYKYQKKFCRYHNKSYLCRSAFIGSRPITRGGVNPQEKTQFLTT